MENKLVFDEDFFKMQSYRTKIINRPSVLSSIQIDLMKAGFKKAGGNTGNFIYYHRIDCLCAIDLGDKRFNSDSLCLYLSVF